MDLKRLHHIKKKHFARRQLPSHYLYKINCTLAFLIGCCSLVSLYAQQPQIIQYSDEDGLPSMTIYTITQDLKGFLWISTDNGVCSYDGKAFKTYEFDDASDLDMIAVYVAPDGSVWSWNISGEVFMLDGGMFIRQRRYEDFPNKSKMKQLIITPNGEVHVLFQLTSYDREYPVYYICPPSDSCYAYRSGQRRSASKNIQPLKVHTELVKRYGQQVQSINSLSYNVFPVGGEITYDYKKKFLNSSNKRVFYHYTIKGEGYTYIQDASSFLKVVRSANDSAYLKEIFLPTSITSNTDLIRFLYQDNEENWWLATNEILYMLDRNFRNYSKNTSITLRIYNPNCMFQDREGGYWIGSNSKGLYYMPNKNILVYNDLIDGWNVQNLVSATDHSVISSTNGGKIISIQNGVSNVKRQFNKNISYFAPKANTPNDFWINIDNVLSIANAGTLQPKTVIRRGSVKSVLETPNATYICTSDYTGKVRQFNYESKTPDVEILHKGRSYDLLQTADSVIWIGGADGLHIYDEVRGDTMAIPYVDKNGKTFSYWINDLELGNDGKIWAATRSQGIYLINTKTKSIKLAYSESNGLPSNICEKIVFENRIEREQLLWVATVKGLCLINLTKNMIKTLNQNSGLPSKRVNCILPDYQEIWVGTTNGIASIPRQAIQLKREPLILNILNIKTGGKTTSIQSEYTLQHNENSFQIDFIAPSFQHQKEVMYTYRMVGLDNQWHTTTENRINYERLQPATYQFKIKASYGMNSSNDVVKSITIKIERPYWQTPWFILFLILLTLSVLVSGFYIWLRIYTYQQKRKDFINQQFSELRLGALQSQMNPHFIFNALNAIQHFFVNNDRESAMIYLAKFARLIRLIFEYSKVSAISLTKEMEFLQLYLRLEKLRFGDRIQIDFQNHENYTTSPEYILLPPLLIQPIIENSFKHGLLHREAGGKLQVSFSMINEDVLRCVVLDNGVGRNKAKQLSKWKPKEYRSSGIQTINERIDLVNLKTKSKAITFEIHDLKDDYNQPIGTKVEFYFDLSRLKDLN